MSDHCARIQERLADEGAAALRDDTEARAHVAACERCYAVLEGLAALDRELDELTHHDAPDVLVASTLERVAAEPALAESETSPRTESEPRPRQRRWRLRKPSLLATSVAVLVVVCAVGWWLGSAPQDRREGQLRYLRIPDAANEPPSGSDVPELARDNEAIRRSGLIEQKLGRDEGELEQQAAESVASKRPEEMAQRPAPSAPRGGDDSGTNARVLEGDYEIDNGYVGDDVGVRRESSREAAYGRLVEQEFRAKESPDTRPKPSFEEWPVGAVIGSSTSRDANEGLEPSVSGTGAVETSTFVGVPGPAPSPSKDRGAYLDADGRTSVTEEDEVAAVTEHGAWRAKTERALVADRKADASERVRRPHASNTLAKQKPRANKKTAVVAKRDDITHADGQVAQRRDTTSDAFLAERDTVDGLAFRDPRGYWANTYAPGDPALRLLAARLRGALPPALTQAASEGGIDLSRATSPYRQPFDAPDDAALAVYLHADKTAIDGPTRLLVQVGIQATPRRSGRRPAMNVGLVLDARGELDAATRAAYRSLVQAFVAARRVDDRFSLSVAGGPMSCEVAAEAFKHGPVSVALADLLATPAPGATTPDASLPAALERAWRSVARADDPTAPLGSSVIVVVTSGSLAPHAATLERMAHESAVGGIPVSAIGVGAGADAGGLEQLVLSGQGNRRALADAAAARDVVERELHAVSGVVARAARLRIRLAHGVKLIDVVGSHRLDDAGAERVRQAEQSVDRRLSRSLGIERDRGEDEEGIQIVIPAFQAGDAHVVLLDVVASRPGAVADVTLRYKDLVWNRNGVTRANLSLGASGPEPGPLERNVLKNLVAHRLATAIEDAGDALARGDRDGAQALIDEARALVDGLRRAVPVWRDDRELARDARMLAAYARLLDTPVIDAADARGYLVDSLRYAGALKLRDPHETDD